MQTKRIALQDIVIDEEVLVRSEVNQDHVEDLFEALKQSEELPPVVVFDDGEAHILVDGRHRVAAAKKCNMQKINAEIHEGSKREATLFACGVNAGHGLRRTNEDKRRAVHRLLTDQEWSGWGDAVIAKHCAVTQAFVWKLRDDLIDNGYKFPEVRIGLNSKKYKTPKKKTDKNSDTTDHVDEDTAEEDNTNNSGEPEVTPQNKSKPKEPPLHTDKEISEVGAAIFNLNNKMGKLNKMIQNKEKWSKERKAKARTLKEEIDKEFITISNFLRKIID